MSRSDGAAHARQPAPAPPALERLDYRPPGWLAGAHLQSVLPTIEPRRRAVLLRARPMLKASRDQVLDCGAGVRLLGHYSPADGARSLVVVHHGWEGSAEANYVLSCAEYLWRRGHSIFRLNLRDHGPTHHLNPEIFHSCRIQEVVGAVRAIQARYAPARLSLVGFSLGGNFALRVAVRAPLAGIELDRVVAICPVLEPEHTLRVLDHGATALYRRYFVRKWRQSLRRKRAAWPTLYDFAGIEHLTDLTSMTEHLVTRHSEFPDLRSYLRGYAITGPVLAELKVPSRILAALDDPIIPAADLERLAGSDRLRVTVTAAGGHCGFLETLFGPSFADRQVLATLEGA